MGILRLDCGIEPQVELLEWIARDAGFVKALAHGFLAYVGDIHEAKCKRSW